MPDVVGQPLKKARYLVENAGLRVDQIVYTESYEERDTVLSQKPSRGQMIYASDGVTLSVSRESYVKWLPALFQRNDINGKNAMRDLLWVTQHLFGSIEEKLDALHNFFDPYEAPEEMLPWLASWSAMVIDEDWPIAKKRRLIKKGIEMYRIRGTVKGLKLFISLFTGNEPVVRENQWPFKGWRIGVTSEIGTDTVVLPPVNLSHAFIVEMPVSYKDLSPEAVIRIHEIIQMERPANTQYYLRFAVEEKKDELREFMVIGTRSGIGISGADAAEAITSEAELQELLDRKGREEKRAKAKGQKGEKGAEAEAPVDDPFEPAPRTKPPLPKAPRADLAPVEGKEIRSEQAGGFGQAAREMQAISQTQILAAVDQSAKTMITQPPTKTQQQKAALEAQKTTQTEAQKTKEQQAASDKTQMAEAPTKEQIEAAKKKEAEEKKKPPDDKGKK
jgi:phage tail-like protein